MSRSASAHPLDMELLDHVEGACDAESADRITAHLEQCLLCRIKRQRLAGAPPMEFTDARAVAPDFVAVEFAPGEGAPQPGELWLTNADDATIVLVKSVRSQGGGVVVVPVTLDVEAADEGVVTLDEFASPLIVPLAIYEDLPVSLPSTALAERIQLRSGVDLLSPFDDQEGASRGTPIRTSADPRLEVRQYLIDRLTALDPYDDAEGPAAEEAADDTPPRVALLREELLLRRGPQCDVQALPNLPTGPTTPHGWAGIARVADFTVRVIVIETPSGLQEPLDFTAAQQLVARMAASALAVCTPESEAADVYDAPALFRAFQLPEGTRSSEPVVSGLWLPDAVAKYLDQKRVVLSTVGLSPHHAPRVDAAVVLTNEIVNAVDATVQRAPRLGADKKDGYLQLPAVRGEVAEVLKRALEPGFDAQWISDAVTGDDK